MPDVGVLNLQIQENSEAAVGGLDKLEGALIKIRDAVNGGLKLAPIANGLEKLGKVVNEQISGSTIVKIGQLADELSKLKGLENVNIRINTGTSVESIREAVSETRETIGGINDGFDEVGERVAEVNSATETYHDTMNRMYQLMQNTGWTGGYQQFKQMLMEFLKMRSAMALGPGTQISTDVEKGWTDWKNGAIEVEGYVSEVHDKIEGMAEVPKLTGGPIQVFASIEDAARALGITVDEAKRRIQAAIDAAGSSQQSVTVFNTIEEAAQAMGISVDEARQMVGEVVETANTPVDGTAFESIGENSFSASRLVDALIEKIEILEEEVQTGQTEKGTILSEKAIVNDRIQIEKLTDQVNRLLDKIHAGQEVGGSSIVDALGDYSKIDLMTMKLDAMRDALANDIEANRLDGQQIASRMLQINNLKDQIESLRQKQDEATDSTHSMSRAFEDLKDRISHLGISNLIKQFMRLARMRAMRAIIKQIASGFREGVENVYNYSKAIGSEFAPSMDSAVSSLLQMKNSIGAAVAPLLQSLIPIMQTLVNWFIQGVNYLNQFVSLLRGQATWTRAVPATASAFDKQTKAAKSAGNAIKDLLADWDELNIIQSQTGGGTGAGGTTAAEDYLNMFEEVAHFNNTIKGIVEGINRQFGGILGLVATIGATMAAWKLSSLVTGVFSTIAGLLASAGIIYLTFSMTTMLNDQYFKTGDIGWLIGDVLQTALGAFLANKVISKVLSAGAGKVAAGVTLVVSAVADVISLIGSTDTSALSTEGILTAVKSGLKLGGGFALFATASGVPTAAAILAGGEAAAIGIGAVIAIKAIADAVNTGEITFETVKAGVAGAVATGLGVTVCEMIGGATLGAALATGGAAALVIGAGFAVALGIVALIDKDHVEWGEISLTDEEVQTFVDTKMFTVSVPITVSIIDKSLTDISADKTDLETKLTNALGTFNVIRLGVAKDEDYTTLAKEILGEGLDGTGGVVGAVSKYVEDAQAMGKLTLKFTPSLVGETETDASAWFTNYTTGWDKVDEFVKSKGAEIGKLLTTEEGKKIIESTPEVLAALMQQVSDVTNAVAGAKISSEAFANLQVSLGDLDEVSYDKVITAYSDYLEQIREKEKQLVIQQYTSQEELVAALFATGADPNEEPLKSAIEKWKYMGEHINDAIEEGVEKYSRPGAEMVVDFLKEHYKEAFEGFDLDLENLGYLSGIKNKAYDLGSMNDYLTDWLWVNDTKLAETLRKTGIYAWNVMGDEAKEKIRKAMEEAFGTDVTKDLIEKWESQTKEQIDESIKNLNGGSTITPPTVQPASPSGTATPYPSGTVVGTGNGTADAPSGTKVSADINNASTSVVGALGTLRADILLELQKIARRPINVNINSNATFGRGVKASLDRLDAVTGNGP